MTSLAHVLGVGIICGALFGATPMTSAHPVRVNLRRADFPALLDVAQTRDIERILKDIEEVEGDYSWLKNALRRLRGVARPILDDVRKLHELLDSNVNTTTTTTSSPKTTIAQGDGAQLKAQIGPLTFLSACLATALPLIT